MANDGELKDIWVPNRRKEDTPGFGERPPRALAVDDDDSYLRLISALLVEVGFEVTVARDGVEALQLLREAEFDLVLLDLKMPGLDGFETLEGSADSRERFYAILLSASDELEIRLEAFNRGFNDFISKKSNYLEITAKLRAARHIVTLQRRLRQELTELKQLAMTDQLTGLSNRFYFFNRARELSASGQDLSVVLFDLDDFKLVNDNHGHLTGDRILADVGAALRTATRNGDVVSRFGGDEFVMLIAGLNADDSERIARRISLRLAALRWNVSGTDVRVTCSFGISSAQGRAKSLPELLAEADASLLERKRHIHNLPENVC